MGLFDNVISIFGITNYPDSFLGKKCKENKNNLLFHLDAPKEESIPATVSVISSMLVLCGILSKIQFILEPNNKIIESILKDLTELPDILKATLSQATLNQIFSFANEFSNHFHNGVGYIVGGGALTSVLDEIALKGIELAKLNCSPVPHSIAHGPLNANSIEGIIYLQDILTSKKVIITHINKLVQYAPVFTIGPYWDINLPNLYTFAINVKNPMVSAYLQLMIMQLIFTVFALIKGLSPLEICYPSMLQKVVLASPIS